LTKALRMKCFAGQKNTESELEKSNLKNLKESISKKERRSKMYKIIFITCLSIINIFSFIQCGSLLGRAGIMYTTTHNNFRDQQRATGLVRMTNGFSVVTPDSGVGSTHGSCAFMDTCISVSGAIDLRETNTIFLQADLILDHGVTFSSGGNIYGYDRALILNGDLTVPDGKIIHTGGRIVIDGNGHKLILGNSAQLFVDTDATLTLRNLVLQNTRNQPGHPAVQCASSASKLCLDDVELALADDFYFNRGQMFVQNDVAVTGTSAFVYRSCQPSNILADSTFYFDLETTLDFRPSTTGIPNLRAKDLLILQDATSQLYMNGCSLKTTMTGMRLMKGQLIFDNKVTITSAAQLQLKSMGTWITQDYGYMVRATNWSPDGRYLAIGGNTPTSGKELQIYSFSGTSLTLVASLDYGTDPNSEVRSVNWSPDGRYLAIGGAYPTSGNEIQIYKFDGSSLTFLTSQEYGTFVYSVNWSPDGRYLAVGGHLPTSGNELQVYSFNGYVLTLVASKIYGNQLRSVNWSPDGRYLAIGGDHASAIIDDLQIYNFNGSSLVLIASKHLTTNIVTFVRWSPDGYYLVATCVNGVSDKTIQIYKFESSSLTLAASQYLSASGAWSADWRADGKYLAIGCLDPYPGHDELEVYTLQYGPEIYTQAPSNSIVFGNSALGSDYDLNVRVLAGAQVTVDGLLNNDNVN